MDLASRFNGTGVHLYQQGHGDEAFNMFHASLQVMLRTNGKTTADIDPGLCQSLALHETIHLALDMDQLVRGQLLVEEFHNKQSGNNSPSGDGSRDHLPLISSRCERLDSNESEHNRRLQKEDHTEQDPCLYTQVFGFSDIGYPDARQYVTAVGTDLYNMALVLHRGQVPLFGSFERALILYSFAGELLWSNLGYSLLQQPDSGVTRLYCAILNNTGYLLHQMGHYSWSQLFFERFYGFLEMLGPASGGDEQRERSDFQLNIFILCRPWRGAAAA